MLVRLLREAGGLGDVLRCLGVARSVKQALPDCEVWFWTLDGYADLARLSPDIDRVVSLGRQARRRRNELPDEHRDRYLDVGRRFDCTVDLYCPAFRYEAECYAPDAPGRVTLSRNEVWTAWTGEKLGIPLAVALARLRLSGYTHGRAAGWLEAHGLGKSQRRGKRLVALQPLSMGRQRCLTWDQTRGMAEVLKAAGHEVLFFHTKLKALGWAGDLDLAGAIAELGVPAALGVDFPLLAALVGACDLVVSGDSGLYHLAAVVGTPALAVFGITSGAIMRKHYPLHAALDATPADRRDLSCERTGRACYAFRGAIRVESCRSWGCAGGRIPTGRIAAAALGMLGQSCKSNEHVGQDDVSIGLTSSPTSCKSKNSVATARFVRPS